jgi:ferredoxin
MKVRVDRDLCAGIGNCVPLVPAACRIHNENKAVVFDPFVLNESGVIHH